ncbi:MAG: hypothetical protein ACJ79K_01595 [Gemmatimonadaceae bacterium]
MSQDWSATTLDATSGYDDSGVRGFFDELHRLGLGEWLRAVDHHPPGAATAFDCAALACALGSIHWWSVWRARDQLATELHHFGCREGQRLLRPPGRREHLTRTTECVALAIVARAHLDLAVFARLTAPFTLITPHPPDAASARMRPALGMAPLARGPSPYSGRTAPLREP